MQGDNGIGTDFISVKIEYFRKASEGDAPGWTFRMPQEHNLSAFHMRAAMKMLLGILDREGQEFIDREIDKSLVVPEGIDGVIEVVFPGIWGMPSFGFSPGTTVGAVLYAANFAFTFSDVLANMSIVQSQAAAAASQSQQKIVIPSMRPPGGVRGPIQ